MGKDVLRKPLRWISDRFAIWCWRPGSFTESVKSTQVAIDS